MNKKIRITVLIAAIIALISTISYCAAPYDTEQARLVEINKSITGSGFILRRETLVTRDISGVFEPTVKEGMRVARGSSIGTVISGNLDKTLAAKLESVTERIEEIKNSDSIAKLYSSDDARIYSALRDLSSGVRENAYKEDYIAANDYKKQLGALIEHKYSSGSTDARDSLLVSLEDEKYSIEQQLGGIRSEVVSPSSGIFYTSLDGLEFSGDESVLSGYTAEDINGFSKTLSLYEGDSAIVAKIVDTYAWYLAATLPKSDADGLLVGDSVSVSVDESAFIDATVLALDTKHPKEAAIIIKCTKNIDGITEKRTAEFEIQRGHCSGIYVPAAALRVKDDLTGVYVLNNNKDISFRVVEILMQDSNFYIVKNKYIPNPECKYKALKIYEDILVNPEAVKKIDKDSTKP